MGAWAGLQEAAAGPGEGEEGAPHSAQVRPNRDSDHRPRRRRKGPGRRPSASREGRRERTQEKEKGQEVPYRHRATLPPHPLRSRCSAPTPGARPRRPTWPPRVQLKGGDQQPPPTPSPASLPGYARGARTRRQANEKRAKFKSREGSRDVGRCIQDSGGGRPAHAPQHPSGAASLSGFASAAATCASLRTRPVIGPPLMESRSAFSAWPSPAASCVSTVPLPPPSLYLPCCLRRL